MLPNYGNRNKHNCACTVKCAWYLYKPPSHIIEAYCKFIIYIKIILVLFYMTLTNQIACTLSL